VVARVKAILRRVGRMDAGARSGISLDEMSYKATGNGRDLRLTAVEFQLLKIFLQQPGRIFTRSQLIDAMYADFRVVSERTVHSHVKKLRQKIAVCLPEQEVIRSVYGLGYKYDW